MPINSNLLAGLRRPQFDSPDDRRANALKLQALAQQNDNAAQTSQINAINIQNAQQEQQDRGAARAEQAAAQKILASHNWDVRASMQEIAQVAPSIVPHLQKMLEDKDVAAGKQLALLQGSDAPEVQQGVPGATFTPEATVPEGGTVAPIPSPIQASYMETQKLPTVNVGGVDIQPRSRQDNEQAAFEKFKREKTIEASLRPPTNIDPNSPAGIAAAKQKALDLRGMPAMPTAPLAAMSPERFAQDRALRAASHPGPAPAVEIVPGSKNYRVAQDLAYGKLTFNDFKSLYGRAAATAELKSSLYDQARQMNPDFNPATFEMGYKLASNPKVQQQLAAMDNVKEGVPDLLKASDAAARSGFTALNKYIIGPAGIAMGDKRYTNLAAARVGFADELSGALGFGSATDMSREMGFNMTDTNLSPEAFRAGIQDVVMPFIDRKKSTLLKQMGQYGQPGMNPAAGPAGGTPDGLSVTTPDGKVHTFKNKADADGFRQAAGIKP